MRVFLALPLPDQVIGALTDLQNVIPAGRISPPGNLHVTLAFLDDISEADAVVVHQAMEAMAAEPVTLQIAGLDTFGGKRPKLVLASATGPEYLQKEVVRALRAAGITLERRKFRPHVTLSRLPHRMHRGDEARLARFLGDNAGFALPPVTIDSFALYRSHLRPEGAEHEVLAEYALTA